VQGDLPCRAARAVHPFHSLESKGRPTTESAVQWEQTSVFAARSAAGSQPDPRLPTPFVHLATPFAAPPMTFGGSRGICRCRTLGGCGGKEHAPGWVTRESLRECRDDRGRVGAYVFEIDVARRSVTFRLGSANSRRAFSHGRLRCGVRRIYHRACLARPAGEPASIVEEPLSTPLRGRRTRFGANQIARCGD